MVDAVSGATRGLLRLEQAAVGGAAGFASEAAGREGGAASGSLFAENTGGGELELVVQAVGGAGASPNNGAGGAGGAAQLGRVTGISTSGNSVEDDRGVLGGSAETPARRAAAATARAYRSSMPSSGETSGALVLRQRARRWQRRPFASCRGFASGRRPQPPRAGRRRDLLLASRRGHRRRCGDPDRSGGNRQPGGDADARAGREQRRGLGDRDALARGGRAATAAAARRDGAGGDATAFARRAPRGTVTPFWSETPRSRVSDRRSWRRHAPGAAELAGGGNASSESVGEALGRQHRWRVRRRATAETASVGGAGGARDHRQSDAMRAARWSRCRRRRSAAREVIGLRAPCRGARGQTAEAQSSGGVRRLYRETSV